MITLNNLSKMIDHTNLKPTATQEDIEKLCNEAKELDFASVCVNPVWVNLAKKILAKSDVKVCTVIGFPLGANTSKIKAEEATNAILYGADEIDMVIDIGALKSDNKEKVLFDIQSVVEASKTTGKTVNREIVVKVIIETCYLTKEEIKIACICAKNAKADFVKTSTGFGTEGAKAEDVRLMKETVGKTMQVKASGGIRDSETALKMIEAGATRLGTSNSVNILKDFV